LTGAPGIGKTRLALETARIVAGRFRDGAAFVDLSTVSDAALVTPAIAQRLGIRDLPGQDLLDTLRAALTDQHLLLVLDNFEHVIAASQEVAALLDAGARLTVLVTSRAPLHVAGEHEFPVPPIALPSDRTAQRPKALIDVPAVALFVERARAVRPDFALIPENAGAVADLCVRLDGLPLAIELAAARVKLLTPSMILHRLLSNLDLLARTAPDVPPRHQTLREAIRWSHDLLGPAAQEMFRRLAVFHGGGTLQAVETVAGGTAGNVLDPLASLVDNSLLLHDPQPDGDSRFRLLDTIREFAGEQLEASGEREDLRSRHAQYYGALAETAEPALSGPDQAAWLERLEREHDNFRAALAHAAERGQHEAGLALAAALGRFWERHGYSTEALSWLSRFVDRAAGAPPTLRAKALNVAGNLARSRGEYAVAIERYEQALALRREAQDPRGIAIALNNLGVAAKDQSDYGRARAFLEESLAIKREQGEQRGIAVTLNNLGLTAKAQGDFAGAARYFDESLDLFRDLGDGWGQALILNNIATLAFATGDFERALALHKTSLAGRRAMKEKWGVAECLEGLARVAEVTGAPAPGAQLLGAADRMRQLYGFPLPPDERPLLEQQMAALRAALGEDAFRAAWEVGQSWTPEEALEAGLALASPATPRTAQATARVRIHLLGRFRIVVDGQMAPDAVWTRPQALSVFQYLLLHRHRYATAEEIVAAFWPDAPSVQATSLYTALSRIRRALKDLSIATEVTLERERAGYRLRVAPDVWLDVDAFTQGLLPAAGRDSGAVIAARRETVALYGGDLLAGADNADWCLEDREALRRKWVEANADLAAALEARGNADEAIAIYTQMLEREPLLEDVHRGLMRCYAHIGRRDLALRQYHLCEGLLASELDVAPEDETVALHAAVSQNQAVPLLASAGRPR
jgi:non-specific serine/threonine protein kinase